MKFFPLVTKLVLGCGLLFAAAALQADPAVNNKTATPREWWRAEQSNRLPDLPNAQVLPRLHVEGNRFAGPDGKPVLLRGVSIADPDLLEYTGHWNLELFRQLKEFGANVVRLPVHPAAWRARTPQKYVELIDQAAEWCASLGMYVIVDWHSIGNLNSDLFQNPMYNTSRAETFNFWKTIAERYAHHSAVAFFELYNEPTTFRGRLGRVEWSQWRAINEDLIALIRGYQAEGIPLVAGFDWAYDLTPIIEDPIRAAGIGYVTHPYPHKRTQPWEPKWQEDFAFAAHSYPLIATEIGFDLKPGEVVNDDHYGNRITRFLESREISWLAWVYDPAWGPQILKSWDGYQLTGAGEFFKQALHRAPAEPAVQAQRKAGDY
ncbi:MAG TPA: cellulase family glycosylhydrolase [Opitutaceae bacterium]